jgi:hypothetical protein
VGWKPWETRIVEVRGVDLATWRRGDSFRLVTDQGLEKEQQRKQGREHEHEHEAGRQSISKKELV